MSFDRRDILKGAAAAAVGLGATTPAWAANADDIAAIATVAAAQQATALTRLRDWIALPTIAAEQLNVGEGAAYTMGLARAAGFQAVTRIPTDGVDGVFATLDVGAPRWLAVYFMYDVKQYDPSEWASPPLEGRIVDRPGVGRVLVGRGAANQKGPQSAFLAAIQAIRGAGQTLPVNLALVCEGEEEIASPHFKQIVTHPAVLPVLQRCEGAFIPFPSQGPTGAVTVQLGAKGPIEFQLVADGAASGVGPKVEIHSSEKARVQSPLLRLVQAVASLTSADGDTPMLDGFMDSVRPLTGRERQQIRTAARRMNQDMRARPDGITRWINNESLEDSLIRLAEQPSINLQGVVGGYAGPGGKSILPSRAEAKLELRMVPDQTYADVARKLREHLDRRGFTDIRLNISGGYDPTRTEETSRLVQSALKAYDAMGVEAGLYPRMAGSWPGSVFTQPPVSIPALQFGMGRGGRQHAPDEFLVVDSIDPAVGGYAQQTMGYVHLLHAIANAL